MAAHAQRLTSTQERFDVGIGHSTHKNEYRGRVLVGNWVEEQGRLEAPSVSRNFDGVSCYRAAYTPYVRRPPLKNTSHKYGADLKQERRGWLQPTQPLGAAFLAHRLDAQGHITPHCLASLYQLTHGSLDEPRAVQTMLWQGYKKNDRGVPLTGDKTTLLSSKQGEHWRPLEKLDQFRTTSREATVGVLLHKPQKQQGCRPAAEGGQPAQIGRKAKGCFAEEFDKTFQTIGLRKS